MTGLFQVHISLCLSVSQQTEVIRKLATCLISLLVFLSVCKFCPVERNVDDDFIATTPFYAQVVYLYLSMLTTRPKYYFVWTLGAWTSCLSFSSHLARFLSPLLFWSLLKDIGSSHLLFVPLMDIMFWFLCSFAGASYTYFLRGNKTWSIWERKRLD